MTSKSNKKSAWSTCGVLRFKKRVFLQVALVSVIVTGRVDSSTVLCTALNSSNHDLMSFKKKKTRTTFPPSLVPTLCVSLALRLTSLMLPKWIYFYSKAFHQVCLIVPQGFCCEWSLLIRSKFVSLELNAPACQHLPAEISANEEQVKSNYWSLQ